MFCVFCSCSVGPTPSEPEGSQQHSILGRSAANSEAPATVLATEAGQLGHSVPWAAAITLSAQGT